MPPEVRPVWHVLRDLRSVVEHAPGFADLWVGGEISNYTASGAGHIYFTLKDEGGALRCAFFRNQNVRLRQRLAAGDSVIVHGALSIYEQRGELQMIVDFVQPAGVGALQAEFERRRAQFDAEGLFEPSRKRALPRFPQRIAVVTSAQGAAYHDITTILARRWPLAAIRFHPTPVQGEEAPVAVAEAIRAAAPHHRPETWPDVVIVGRGGGAAEDLWAFNEEPVIRAIFACPVPVISAVGHETDVTLADLVADVRAATPSAAAELAAPDTAEVARALRALAGASHARARQRIALAQTEVRRLSGRADRLLPDTAEMRRRVMMLGDGLAHHAHREVRAHRESAAAVAARLATLSPEATLARGYALVSRTDGTPAARAAQVASGDTLRVMWVDGSREVQVQSEGRGL